MTVLNYQWVSNHISKPYYSTLWLIVSVSPPARTRSKASIFQVFVSCLLLKADVSSLTDASVSV